MIIEKTEIQKIVSRAPQAPTGGPTPDLTGTLNWTPGNYEIKGRLPKKQALFGRVVDGVELRAKESKNKQ